MRSRFKAFAVVAAALGIASTGGFVAYASWNTRSPDVSLKVRAATMPRGVTPKVTAVGRKAVVRWRAQQVVTGVPVTSYVVTAHNWAGNGSQDVTLTRPATGGSAETVSFAVSGGKWTWTIVPKFGSWSGRRSAPTKPFTVPADPDVIPRVSPSTAEQRSVESIPKPIAGPTTSSPTPAVPSVPALTASISPSESATAIDPVIR
jgi:hypothetical protein